MSTSFLPLALAEEVVVSRAASAARRGDLDQAAALLTELGAETPAVLNLLARVRAQQGQWEEADRCWARVQELHPADAEAAAGRKSVAKIVARKRPGRPIIQPLRVAVVAGTAAVAVIAGAVVWLDDGGPRAPAAEPSPSTAVSSPVGGADPRLQEQTRRADELQRQLAQLDAQRKAAAAQLAARLEAISRQVALPGVIVQRRPDSVRVLFRDGAFARDAELTAASDELLTRLGARLANLDATITVVGHSVAVPGGPASGGSRMALARARVGAQRLADGGKLPLTTFALESADQRQGPFREAARNRTVSLLITPRR
ncbi:MAG TPA: hypothetical protein VGD34_13525 [Kribbella sp.]